MSVAASMSEVAALVGDRARGEILSVLLGGRALTAKELAYVVDYAGGAEGISGELWDS